MAEILERNGYRVKIKVEVPASEVDKAYESALSQYAKSVRLPGFRPGKAPTKVVESRIGREALLGDVQEKLLDSSYPEAIKELDLSPVGVKLIEADLDFNKPFIYVAEVENYPDVKLPEWRTFKVDAAVSEVTEEMMSSSLNQLRERYGELTVVDREAQEKDNVFIETEDGGRFPVVLENAQPHVVKALLGKKAGDETKVPVMDGDDVIREIPTKIVEVKALVLPELDDEFAKTVGEDDLATLTGKLREGLESQIKADAENGSLNQLLDQVAAGMEAEIPPSMQNQEEQNLLQSLATDLKQQNGIELKDYIAGLEASGKTEEFKAELSENATKRLRRSLASEALAEELGTNLGEDEWTNFIEGMARSYQVSVAKFQKDLGKDALNRLRIQRTHDKAVYEALQQIAK